MEIYPLDIVIHIINIVIFYLILRLLLFKPVRKFMSQREQRIQSQLDEAERMKKEAEAIQAEYDGKLAEADAACKQIIATGRKLNTEAGQKVIDEAQEEAAKILSQAREEAQEQKTKILDSAKGDLTDLAVEMAGRVLKFEDQVKERVASDAKELSGNRKGVLKVARPCSEEEAAALTQRMEALLGCHLQLDVQVDESLLGGYAVFVDGKVYDFSYKAQLAEMKHKLS